MASRAVGLSLKVVTGAGEVLELNGLVKKPTGYDLRFFSSARNTLGCRRNQNKSSTSSRTPKQMVLGVPLQDVSPCSRAFKGTLDNRVRFFGLADQSDGAPETTRLCSADRLYALVEFDAAMDKRRPGYSKRASSGLGDGFRAVAERRAGEDLWQLREGIRKHCAVRHTKRCLRAYFGRAPISRKRSIASRASVSRCAGTGTSATATCT
jgi:hypothetical protein